MSLPGFYDPQMAKYWVRFHMSLMVEVDDDVDEVTRGATLPNEIHEARDDSGQFMVFDDQFVRHPHDSQPYLHAWSVAQPRSQHDMFFIGPPRNTRGAEQVAAPESSAPCPSPGARGRGLRSSVD